MPIPGHEKRIITTKLIFVRFAGFCCRPPTDKYRTKLTLLAKNNGNLEKVLSWLGRGSKESLRRSKKRRDFQAGN